MVAPKHPKRPIGDYWELFFLLGAFVLTMIVAATTTVSAIYGP